MQDEEDDYGEREDPDGHEPYPLAACVVCGTETRLRCAPCEAAVCHLCTCPNGCDRDGPELIAFEPPAIE